MLLFKTLLIYNHIQYLQLYEFSAKTSNFLIEENQKYNLFYNTLK